MGRHAALPSGDDAAAGAGVGARAVLPAQGGGHPKLGSAHAHLARRAGERRPPPPLWSRRPRRAHVSPLRTAPRRSPASEGARSTRSRWRCSGFAARAAATARAACRAGARANRAAAAATAAGGASSRRTTAGCRTSARRRRRASTRPPQRLAGAAATTATAAATAAATRAPAGASPTTATAARCCRTSRAPAPRAGSDL